MISKYLYLSFICLLILSCSNTTTSSAAKANSTKKVQTKKRRSLPDTVYKVDLDNNGIYLIVDIPEEDKPKPIQGKEQFVRDLYGKIKYPAIARENGVSGIVILNIDVDQKGKVKNISVHQTLSRECDAEDIKALTFASDRGYYPLIWEGKPTAFRMETSLGFWLQ